MEMPVTRRVAAATIVEYSDRKQAANRYPYRIVSPSSASLCCAAGMKQVGDEQREGEWPFVYMRCSQCGFTIRRFESADSLFGCSNGEAVEVEAEMALDIGLESLGDLVRLPARQDKPSFLYAEPPPQPLRELWP